MVNGAIEGLEWPKPDELKRIASERTLSSNELLALKSRSFYLPIWMLELTRGRDECNKRTIVTALYNILREQDTIEDANPAAIPAQAKIKMIDHFGYIMNNVVKRSPSEPISDLISDLELMTTTLLPGAMDDDEKVFLEQFAKGSVLEDVRANATQTTKEHILLCVGSMATGMKRFLEHGKIDTKEQMAEYCSYVAGDVGVALNRLVDSVDKVRLDDNCAKTFGRSLQQINIIKNIHEDWKKRGVVYVPKELYADVDNETLFNPESKEGKSARKSVLETMIADTTKDLKMSADYIVSIPQGLTGYRGFTAIPFFAAIETLRAIEAAGAEKLFGGEEGAAKISPEVFGNIASFAYQIMRLQEGKKAGEFMQSYRDALLDRPKEYSFEPRRFEIWTEEQLKS
jgi:farnesyl-diphosphate farnesyltransferase